MNIFNKLPFELKVKILIFIDIVEIDSIYSLCECLNDFEEFEKDIVNIIIEKSINKKKNIDGILSYSIILKLSEHHTVCFPDSSIEKIYHFFQIFLRNKKYKNLLSKWLNKKI